MDIKSINLEMNAFISFRQNAVEPVFSDVIAAAKQHLPSIYDELISTYNSEEVLTAKCLTYEYPLLDALGIDFLVGFNGKRYAIDVTKGTRCTVKQKLAKLNERADFYNMIDAIPVILRSATGYIPNRILEYIEQSKTNGMVLDCRLGKKLELLSNKLQCFMPKNSVPMNVFFENSPSPQHAVEHGGVTYAVHFYIGTNTNLPHKAELIDRDMATYKDNNLVPLIINSKTGLMYEHFSKILEGAAIINKILVCEVEC